MRAKLTRIRSSHQNLQDKEITGEAGRLPRAGVSFSLVAPSGVRFAQPQVLTTTRISRVEKNSDQAYEFWTRNSHYSLAILEEVH